MREIISEETRREDQNSIIFYAHGAIDYDEKVNIELSLVERDGFTEFFPIKLIWKINEIKHIQEIVDSYFYKILGRCGHISDLNKDLPEEKRFTKVFYRCYRKFSHSHWGYGAYERTALTLDEVIEHIKKENMSIQQPRIKSYSIHDYEGNNRGTI